MLAGAAGAAGAVLLSGCDGGPSGGDSVVPLERRMRDTAVRDSARLLERYDATTAAHPALAERIAPLRAAVAAHTAALSPAATGSPSAAASSPPSGGTGAAAPAVRPGGPVPAKPADALAELADAERTLSESRTVDLAAAPGELARLLASVAACGAVHAYLLTSNPGAAS